MSRVLLIRPLCEGEEPEFAEPLGLERLAGYLRAHGQLDVHLFDRRLYEQERKRHINTSTFWRDVQSTYREAPPTHVGISLMTSTDMPDALRIISRLRAYYPHARFCVGGVFVTTAASTAAQHLPQDIQLLRGEGEAQLLAWVQDKEPTSAVLTPDDWAQAYRPNIARYAALMCAVNLQTSRGCPGACTFCATPSLPKPFRSWKPRELRLVADEIEQEASRLATAGQLPIFNFVDDDFGPLSRVEALADELFERNLVVSFALEMRMAALVYQPNLAKRLANLQKAGLTRVFVGVESLNPRTLHAWSKPYDVSRLPKVVDAFAQAHITLQTGYILWHRNQTVSGAKRDLAELRRLGIYSHRAALSRLIAFPGCRIDPHEADLNWEAQAFYDKFVACSAELTTAWTAAAIEEPHAAASAHLTGDNTRLRELHSTLDEINRRSYELFMHGE